MIEPVSANAASVFIPDFFYPQKGQHTDLISWQQRYPGCTIFDLFESQKKEVFKLGSPAVPLSNSELNELYSNYISDKDAAMEGVWVYYPWLHKMLHILPEDEFIRLRTNRNFYKITPEEQSILSTKTIGIIGLSVGHAVALTLASERVCGKMLLADFDQLETSNLNRIRTGLHNIGINKAIITAREIAEIDPFIEIACFTEGITEENIDAFLLSNEKLDILVDECDSLDIKILCRQRAKMFKIPVVMETSDRGMLDVERYDLEHDRPLIHGLLDGLPVDQLKNLTTEQKIPLVLKIANIEKVSTRGKISMLEVGQTIGTWPQLASAVTLGGAVVTDVCRRILLEQFHDSGRYYIDMEELAAGHRMEEDATFPLANPYPVFSAGEIFATLQDESKSSYQLSEDELHALVKAANQAPSHGNDQPWKWIYRKGLLYLFHDQQRSYAFYNYKERHSYIALGAACENLLIQAGAMGIKVSIKTYFELNPDGLVASFSFELLDELKRTNLDIKDQLFERCTNRNPGNGEPVLPNDIDALSRMITEDVVNLTWITDKGSLLALGEVIGECDRLMMLHPQGHQDYLYRDLRWTPETARATRDGIDITTLGLSVAMRGAFTLLADPSIAQGMRKTNTGRAIVNASISSMLNASALAIFTVPDYEKSFFFKGGRAVERFWLKAQQLGFGINPVNSPFFLFPRLTLGAGEGLNPIEMKTLTELRKKFLNTTNLPTSTSGLFICKVSKSPKPLFHSLRLPLASTLTIINE